LVEGNPASPVRVVIFEDLQCPDCADFRAMLDRELLPRFGEKVAFEHHDFPLAKHAWARKAAIAARFLETISPVLAVEFRKTVMADQPKISVETFDTYWAGFAKSHGVDAAQASAALADSALAALVERDYQDGVARGIARTPTVLVDGEPFIETFPLSGIVKSIEREIALH